MNSIDQMLEIQKDYPDLYNAHLPRMIRCTMENGDQHKQHLKDAFTRTCSKYFYVANVQIIGPGYLTTLQGACKVIEAISSMIAVLLVTLDFMGFVIDIFQAAGVVSSIVSIIFFIVYITGLVEKSTLPWNRIQFFFHFLWSIFYVAAIVLIYVEGYSYPKIIAGGVFGIVAVMAHLVDSVDNYKKLPLCNLGEK